MSTDSGESLPRPPVDDGPLGPLPRFDARRLRLQRGLRAAIEPDRLQPWIAAVNGPLDEGLALGAPEVLERASGLRKPGLVAQVSWPLRQARLGLGLETPLVHALIDRLLGFQRGPGEERLPVTPIERGLIAYLLARALAESGAGAGLILDQVGDGPFPVEGLGPVVTVRWPAQVGTAVGSIRLWLPETLALPSLNAPEVSEPFRQRAGVLAAIWQARAGETTLPRGLGWLRVGGVLPLDGAPLRGTAASPEGRLELIARADAARYRFAAEAVAGSGGGRLRLTSPLHCDAVPREAVPVSISRESTPAPTEVPVTLVVELGRVTIPLHRLADLKPGDVLELGRHAREPVELTSNGRLVARGELVQIDTELGVRITNVLL